MSTEQKLIDDVKGLLRAAGYVNITSSTSSSEGTTTVSAQKGSAGAVFHLTPQIGNKASLRQTGAGGHEPDFRPAEVAIAPSIPELHDLITEKPTEAAKLLGVTPDVVQHIMAVNPRQ